VIRARALAAGFGLVFGFVLAWARFTDPDAIRQMLLLEDGYLWLVFFTAVALSFVGLRLLRRARRRAVLTGEPVEWSNPPVARNHVVGSVVFGLGWGIADACPGPIATQLGQGVMWSVFTIGGIAIGISLFGARQRAAAAAR
jgi:uncharacterized protein